jgi:hypothetical protein
VVRKVKIGSSMVPCWEAGAAYMPYGQGYFMTGTLIAGATVDWAFDPHIDPGAGQGFGDFGGLSGGWQDMGGGGFDGGGGGGDP